MNRKSKIFKLTILISLLAAVSCGRLGLYTQERGEMVASVGIVRLYQGDIDHLFDNETSAEDSLKLRESYIQNWIKNEVKIAAAEKQFSEDEQQIDELVNQYRRSLLTSRYEEREINLKLDTTVTLEQIESYYNDHKDNFRLAGPVVKAAIVRLPSQLRRVKEFEEHFKKNSPESAREFQAICEKNGYPYNNFSNQWVDFSRVITNIPFTESDFDKFLRSNKFFEALEGDYKYLMKIDSYRPTDDYTPIELQKDNIRKIILNSRRAEIISQTDKKLLEDAYREKKIQIK